MISKTEYAPYFERYMQLSVLKDKTIIGFFVYIEYFDKIVRKALSGQNPTPAEDNSEIT